MKTQSIKSNFTRREFVSTAGLGAASMLTPPAFILLPAKKSCFF